MRGLRDDLEHRAIDGGDKVVGCGTKPDVVLADDHRCDHSQLLELFENRRILRELASEGDERGGSEGLGAARHERREAFARGTSGNEWKRTLVVAVEALGLHQLD